MTHTGICKGGPMDGKTVTGGDVLHFRVDTTNCAHRYQYDRGTYRHQGRRNIMKHGMDDVTVRVCLDCAMVREDYVSAICPACGSKGYVRG